MIILTQTENKSALSVSLFDTSTGIKYCLTYYGEGISPVLLTVEPAGLKYQGREALDFWVQLQGLVPETNLRLFMMKQANAYATSAVLRNESASEETTAI